MDDRNGQPEDLLRNMSKEELACKGSVPARLAESDYQHLSARPSEPRLEFTLASDEIEVDRVITRVSSTIVLGGIRVIQFPAVNEHDLIVMIMMRDVRKMSPEGTHQKFGVL